jgi:hypothetical protein
VILDLAWNMTASTKKYEGSSNESLACWPMQMKFVSR